MSTTLRPGLYPTRVTGEAVPQPRVDPTVWGTAPGPLGKEQLDRYESSGYLVLENLLSPEEVETCFRAGRLWGAGRGAGTGRCSWAGESDCGWRA